MTYTELNNIVQKTALRLPNVHSYTEGDIYSNWHNANIQYAAVNMGLESIQRNNNTVTYTVILYYADRPVKDNSNVCNIYDDGVRIIQSILDLLPDDITYDLPVSYVPFELQFEDVLDGCYARINLETAYEIGHCSVIE